ncbi:hypothetical protein Tco_0994052, partial [Tanacetum coccineum]
SEEDKVDEEEIEWLCTDEEEKKQDDDDYDRSIDLKETDDKDEYAKYKAHVEGDETGKDDTAKADDEKTEQVKGADKQAGIEMANVDQAKDTSAQNNQATSLVFETSKEMPELPPTSSSLSISSSFGNQFLNLSSSISLMGTIKDFTDVKINTLLDIQIQQEFPQIQSPACLIVSTLKKDVKELKQVDHSAVIFESIRSQVPPAVNEFLGSSLGDSLQKVLQKHTEELKQEVKQQES